MREVLPPFLSIVIPTHDRASELCLCLEALQNAQIPAMECIVVDDGSSIGIAALLENFSLPIKLLRTARQSGSAAARNMGASAATGDILLFLDDDVCIQPNSLSSVVAAFQDETLGALMGRYDDAPSAPHFLSQFRNLLHAYTHRISAGPASTFWTGFGAVRASIFREHGGFTEERHAMDDVEFGTRLARAGVRIQLRPDLQVKHLKRWTLSSMLRTDLVLRGIPWTILVWRHRRMPNTLNLRHSSRLSVVLAFLTFLLAGLSLARSIPWFVPLLTLIAVLILNLRFYKFLRQCHGNRFALRGVAAHWLYFLTAGSSFAVGTVLYLARLRRPHAVPSPIAVASEIPPGLQPGERQA